jgi:hypothetical protein
VVGGDSTSPHHTVAAACAVTAALPAPGASGPHTEAETAQTVLAARSASIVQGCRCAAPPRHEPSCAGMFWRPDGSRDPCMEVVEYLEGVETIGIRSDVIGSGQLIGSGQ